MIHDPSRVLVPVDATIRFAKTGSAAALAIALQDPQGTDSIPFGEHLQRLVHGGNAQIGQPLLQLRGLFRGPDRQPLLDQAGAGVEPGGHVYHRDAGFRFTFPDRPGDRCRPAIFREQ